MLTSERMLGVVVLAEKKHLVRLVHVLHALGRVQLAGAIEHDSGFLRGAAAHSYFPAEHHLVALRSVKDYLQLVPPAKIEPVSEFELIATLPMRMEVITEQVRSCRERIEALTAEAQRIDREIAALAPLAGLPVPLDLLGGYENLEAVAVRLPNDAAPSAEVPFREVEGTRGRRSSVRLFVTARRHGARLREHLEKQGAVPLDLPEQRPHTVAGEQEIRLRARRGVIDRDLEDLRAELGRIADEHRDFLFAAEEALVSLLEKNAGSTFLAVSEYALAARFWVPESEFEEVRQAVREKFPSGVELVVEGGSGRTAEVERADHGEEAPPPTRLRNNAWTRPFETLVELFALPRYGEVDPSGVMSLCFPLFFGFMLGDLGYGVLLAALGLLLGAKFRRAPREAGDMLRCLIVGGVSGALFGLFVYGDCFGVPFHEEPGAVFWWSKIVPGLPHPLLSKVAPWGVSAMLVLSILAGWLHMSLGCVFGVLNAWGHSLRHAAGRVGQLLLIAAFALLVLSLGSLRDNPVGRWLWAGLLAPADAAGVSGVVLALFLPGFLLYVVGEGPMAMLEFFGLFGNVVSFTRLALVGVSKGAVAIALNAALLPAIFRGGSAAFEIALAAALLLGHFGLALLGALSCSIQSARLHYCETFSKFYQGGGVRFLPFGMAHRVYTRT